MEHALSRRERERLSRRTAMLEAARSVFAEKGYVNATLEEIAHRAEFGKGTLYNYFQGGKEEILFCIFDELYDELCTLMEGALSPVTAGGRRFRTVFQGFLEACFGFFLERQELFLILMKEAHRMIFSDDPGKAAYFKGQHDRMVNTLVAPFEEAMACGELRDFPASALAQLVLGNLNGLQMHLCLKDEAHCNTPATIKTPQEAARFLTTVLLDGLLVQPEPALVDKHA